MSKNILNRQLVLKAFKEELVGLSPQGKEIDCSTSIRFENSKESYLPEAKGKWKKYCNATRQLNVMALEFYIPGK